MAVARVCLGRADADRRAPAAPHLAGRRRPNWPRAGGAVQPREGGGFRAGRLTIGDDHGATMTGATFARQRLPSARLAGVRALVGVQCLGAFNDNVYKMVVSLTAADIDLAERSGAALLSLSSIAFVAPYILFSGYAGHVADRFDKRSVLIAAKFAEMALMVLAYMALTGGPIEALVVILFLLSTQATFFSPAKYGILPELLAPAQLS